MSSVPGWPSLSGWGWLQSRLWPHTHSGGRPHVVPLWPTVQLWGPLVYLLWWPLCGLLAGQWWFPWLGSCVCRLCSGTSLHTGVGGGAGHFSWESSASSTLPSLFLLHRRPPTCCAPRSQSPACTTSPSWQPRSTRRPRHGSSRPSSRRVWAPGWRSPRSRTSSRLHPEWGQLSPSIAPSIVVGSGARAHLGEGVGTMGTPGASCLVPRIPHPGPRQAQASSRAEAGPVGCWPGAAICCAGLLSSAHLPVRPAPASKLGLHLEIEFY